MFPITPIGESKLVAAATATAATVNGADFVLVSNTGSTTAWSDFAASTSAAVPTTPLLPIPPAGQVLIRARGAAYWCSSIGGVTVTPVQLGVSRG